MSTAARRPAAGQAVKMIPELIIPSALARPCMNGARQPKNASVRPDTNILVPVPDIPAARATAVTTNIKNVNAPRDILGTRRPELAFAAVLINTPAQVVISPAGQVRLVAENIPPANAQPASLGTHRAECASATARIGARSIKTALV